MTTETQIAIIADKLAQLKLTLNTYSDNLSLEQYDHLHGDIEELQRLVLDWVRAYEEEELCQK